MRLIGLLGGMSWQSSIEYERTINQIVSKHIGGVASADLLIRSFDFAQLERLQAAGDWNACAALLSEAARALEAAGAQAVAICTNTMHHVADHVERSLTVPLLHIADATGRAAAAHGIKTIALLGTRYTMELPFMRERLANQFGIEVRVPNQADRDEVHRIIYEELVLGQFSNESRRSMLNIMQDLISGGAQGIIAGCTEIEQLVSPDVAAAELGVRYFPTARLHAEAIAEYALQA